METVHSDPFDFHVFGTGPGRQQPAYGLGLLHLRARFARPQHEFPALTVAGCDHMRAGACRIANELDVSNRLGQVLGVNDQPILFEGAAAKGNSQRLPHRRTGAVGAN